MRKFTGRRECDECHKITQEVIEFDYGFVTLCRACVTKARELIDTEVRKSKKVNQINQTDHGSLVTFKN
jgi:bacterioferritin-associated ferredoxin